MANAIENWRIDLQYYSDNKIGLAGSLFETCLNLLRQLIKECAKSQSDVRICQCLRTEAHRFILWGDGIGAEHGALDVVLAESQHLRKTVIYFLDACGTCLTSLANRLSTSSQLSDICKEIKLLQERVKNTMVEPQEHIADGKTAPKKESDDKLDAVNLEMESTGMSDSEFSTGSNEPEETLEDLKIYIDCLLDLAPALEDPAKDLAVENQLYNSSEEKDMSEEVHVFFTEIMFRWPFIDNLFARRLAEANLKRRERLRAKLLQVQLNDDEEEADDESLAMSESSRASSWALSSPTSYAATMTSGFNKPAPSETSLATSFNEEDPHVFGRRVPQLSENHDWGAAFRCIVCGHTLRDIDSPARWKKHVFEDLQPYLCSFPDCANGENTFASQRAWINHEFTIHRIDRHWYCFYCPWEHNFTAEMCREHIHRLHEGTDYPHLTQDQLDDLITTTSRVRSQPINKQECPFCLTVVGDTVAKFGAHVGQHMREISLAAIPFTARDALDDEIEEPLNENSEVEETDNESDPLQVDQLSRSESSYSRILDEAHVPSLESVRVVSDFGGRSFSCVAVNSRRRRCRNLISSNNVHKFHGTLKRLQEYDKALRIVLSDLEELASLVLCRISHQPQATKIAQAWLAEIRSNAVTENQSNSQDIF